MTKKTTEYVYISYIRWPGEKAHASYVTSHLASLGALSVSATLVVPRRFGVLAVDPAEFFATPITFAISRLPSLDLLWLPVLKRWWHWLGLLTFSLGCLWWVRHHTTKDTVISSNDLWLAWLLSHWRRVVYEVHDYPGNQRLMRSLVKRVYRVQSNNQSKLTRLKTDYELTDGHVFVVHNGVALERFGVEDKTTARTALGLQSDHRYVVYTGHLYAAKGAAVLAEAAKTIPEIDVLLVGGTTEDIAQFKADYSMVPNLHLVGHQPPAMIPRYLAAADIVVAPNSGESEQSAWQTSPMKVFEYLAAGRPLVASDLPALREVTDPAYAVLVPPDDPVALAAAIKTLAADSTTLATMGDAAKRVAKRYSWSARSREWYKAVYD